MSEPSLEAEETPVPRERIAARGSLLAIVLLWAFGLVVAMLAAWPVYGVARAAYGNHPEGDQVLFRPGALELADLVIGREGTLTALAPAVAAFLVLGALLAHLPHGAVLAHMAFSRGERPLGIKAAYRRGREAFFPLLSVTLLSLVVKGILITCGALAASGLASLLASKLDDRSRDLVELGALSPFLGLVVVVGVVADVGQATIARRQVGALRGLRLGLRAFRARKAYALGSWASRALGAVLLYTAAALIVTRLGVAAFGASLVAHQAAALGRAALRASWLARALRLVDMQEPPAPVEGDPAQSSRNGAAIVEEPGGAL